MGRTETSELAFELLKGLEENNANYEPLYNTDSTFGIYIDILKGSLKCIIYGNGGYPYDEVIYDYSRYVAYLREITISKDEDEFWSYVSDVRPLIIEASDDFTYFVVKSDNKVNKYDTKSKILRRGA